MLHRVAGGEITPPKRSGGLTRPLLRMLAADPAERPSITEVRDPLAALVAGHEGDTTTVLLARTNLRSAAAGRTPTQVSAQKPVETPPVAEPVVPAAVPPVPPSTVTPRPAAAPAPVAPPPRTSTPPPSVDDTGRRRRVPALWLVVGLVALLVVGLITFLVIQGGTGSPTAAGSGTSSATTPATAAGAATSGSSAGASNSGGAATSSSSATTPPAAAGGGSLTADNIRTFLTSYHQLVISNPHQAYTETGPTLRASESEPNYVNYWGQFSSVRLTGIQATDGQRTATATVTFTYQNGRQLTEQHRFTLLQRGNSLVLDSDYKA
jgi:hypothetical protein